MRARLSTSLLLAALVLSVVLAAVAAISTTQADTGDELALYGDGIPPCPERPNQADTRGTGTGIAFDGETLYLSCWESNVLQRVDASDGRVLEPIPISGILDIAAMSWDPTREKIWACSFGQVYLIDIDTLEAELQFSLTGIGGGGCWNALAYDATDDTLWTSCDLFQCVQIAHLSATDETEFELVDWPDLPGSEHSGIVRAGQHFYVANDGHYSIFQCSLELEECSEIVYSEGDKFQDLECDDVTFAPKVVVWSQNAFDRVLHAWEIDEEACFPQEREPTATHTAEPTATQTAEPTATHTAEPTATNTSEPTATRTSEPAATNTSVPPTATSTQPAPNPTSTSAVGGVAATPTVQRVSVAAGAQVQRVRQLPATGSGRTDSELADWLADFALAVSVTGVVAGAALELRRRAAGQ